MGEMGRAGRRYGFVLLALLAGVLAACGGEMRTNDNPTSDLAAPGLLPGEVVTRQGSDSAWLYGPVFLVAVIVFVLVEGLVLFITWRFRRRGDDTGLPAQTHGNNRLEVLWTAIPFAVVMGLFVVSTGVLNTVQAMDDEPAVTVDATAFQWQWTFEYRDAGLSYTGSGKQGPEMVVPVDETVRIRLHAADVIHAFYVPAFFYKKDVVPGRTNEFDVLIEEPGTYGGQCAEFCGLKHADMYFTVRAVSRSEYDGWLEAEIDRATATPPPAPTLAPGETEAPRGLVLRIRTSPEAPIAFDQAVLTAPAGELVTVEYLNDSPVPHNIAFYEGSDASAPVIAVSVEASAARPGPGDLQTLTFEAPSQPGSYYFNCQLHPVQMTGTFEVTP